MKPHLRVVGAVAVRAGLVFATRRGPGGEIAGLWEFPGGKVEPGESEAGALAREIREELGVEAVVGDLVARTAYEYQQFQITLATYWTELLGEPVLREHCEARWLPTGELRTLDWAPADLPAVAAIVVAFGKGRNESRRP